MMLINNVQMKALYLISSLWMLLLLQSCSGNGFHLRKELALPINFQRIQVENISYGHEFVKAFEEELEESGGVLVEDSLTKIMISNFREGKRVIAYTSERKAREFLLSLKFDYLISSFNNKTVAKQKYRINLDRVFIYDTDFALGKAEEESKIRRNLYQEAARLILFKLQYKKE